MAFAQRKDLVSRVAGEKAQKPDEFLTRSQIIPGTNITFDYLTNWDIKINALTGGTTVVTGDRMISGTLQFSYDASDDENDAMFSKNTLMKNASLTRYHVAADADTTTDTDSIVYGESAQAQRFFSTLVYADIVHNWDLPNRNNFLISFVDMRNGLAGASSFKCIPKAVGIDTNTVRIFVGIFPSGTYTDSGWENWSNGNTDTDKIGDSANFAYGSYSDIEEGLTLRFTLQEGGEEAD